MSDVRVVGAEGDPHARGVTIGRELRDLMTRSIDSYHSYFDRHGVTSPQLSDLLTPYIEPLATHPPSTLEDAMAILRDHNSTPASICLHPDPVEGDEDDAVLFSMVCDVESGRRWVADGLPCEDDFEEIDVAGVI